MASHSSTTPVPPRKGGRHPGTCDQQRPGLESSCLGSQSIAETGRAALGEKGAGNLPGPQELGRAPPALKAPGICQEGQSPQERRLSHTALGEAQTGTPGWGAPMGSLSSKLPAQTPRETGQKSSQDATASAECPDAPMTPGSRDTGDPRLPAPPSFLRWWVSGTKVTLPRPWPGLSLRLLPGWTTLAPLPLSVPPGLRTSPSDAGQGRIWPRRCARPCFSAARVWCASLSSPQNFRPESAHHTRQTMGQVL